MKLSELKKIIKEVIHEQDDTIPQSSSTMDKLYKNYKENGLDTLQFDDAAMNDVDSNFVRNFYAYKKLRNALIKFIELYGRTNNVN